MLDYDFVAIGNRLFSIRKKAGMTQAEVAEAAGLSDRAYADIERGTVQKTRLETILRICGALHITPDEILIVPQPQQPQQLEGILEKLDKCSSKEKQTAIQLLETYLNSLC